MDATFDTLARLFGSGMTRRDTLRGLVAGAAAATAGAVLIRPEDAAAKRRKNSRKRNRRHDRCGRQGDGCGALDADTGQYTAPYCCRGYACVYDPGSGSGSWTCQVAS